MIITPKFTLIHMHKTGGQTLSQIVNSNFPNCETVGYHFPISELPLHAASIPIVGMVRNPWDWYLSWYAFNTHPRMYNPLYVIMSDGGNGDFESTVTNLINLGSSSRKSAQYRTALKALLPETLAGNQGVGLTKSSIDELESSGKGYYSWLFERMHGDLNNKQLHIGQFESLNQDFISIISKLNVEQTQQMKLQLDSLGRTNSSSHSHYSHYYSDELKDLVEEKDSDIVNLYGYQYESSPNESEESIRLAANIHFSFKKLLGNKANFLSLASSIDVSAIELKLAQCSEEQWAASGRETLYEPHRDTQAIPLLHDNDFRHRRPSTMPLFSFFRAELEPLFERFPEFYQSKGYFIRILFAKLKAGGNITPHIDRVPSLLNCHRVHLPIITNPDVLFSVGGESIHIPKGELVEINNATVHAVNNNSEFDRVHLIIDWVPYKLISEIGN